MIILGKTETDVEKLKSILAQMEYNYRIQQYHEELGVQFRTHMYVPERHPITGKIYCEWEMRHMGLRYIANLA